LHISILLQNNNKYTGLTGLLHFLSKHLNESGLRNEGIKPIPAKKLKEMA